MKAKFSLIFLFTVCLTNFILPKPSFPGGTGGGPTPDCWPPPCVPIDGGISLLIAAGAIYGGKKLYDTRKEKNSL